MKAYIGTKIIMAEPSNKPRADGTGINDEGYRVVYPDGYESWSPKDVFEGAYREVSDDEGAIIRGLTSLSPAS